MWELVHGERWELCWVLKMRWVGEAMFGSAGPGIYGVQIGVCSGLTLRRVT